MRYVHKDRRIYDFSHCRLCGTSWGAYPDGQCPPATCLACGTTQCLVNGLARGTCGVCLVGLLPGWAGNDRTCGYRDCGEPAVARAPRVRYVCRGHLARAGIAARITEGLAWRERAWTVVSD